MSETKVGHLNLKTPTETDAITRISSLATWMCIVQCSWPLPRSVYLSIYSWPNEYLFVFSGSREQRQSYCLKRISGQISDKIKLNIDIVCLAQQVSCHNSRSEESFNFTPPCHQTESCLIQLDIWRWRKKLFIITQREYFRI